MTDVTRSKVEAAVLARFKARLEPAERRLLVGLDRPAAIQDFLNRVPYSDDKFYRCPLRVLRDRKAHCFDGALFAAHALRRIGFPPLILELIPNERDDDHILALFKQNGGWGAVAQSNFVGLRYREPVYRSLRELVMSYFEQYYNLRGEKTLRRYSRPVNLARFDHLGWMTSEEDVWDIPHHLVAIAHVPLLTPAMIAGLGRIDARLFAAGQLGMAK